MKKLFLSLLAVAFVFVSCENNPKQLIEEPTERVDLPNGNYLFRNSESSGSLFSADGTPLTDFMRRIGFLNDTILVATTAKGKYTIISQEGEVLVKPYKPFFWICGPVNGLVTISEERFMSRKEKVFDLKTKTFIFEKRGTLHCYDSDGRFVFTRIYNLIRPDKTYFIDSLGNVISGDYKIIDRTHYDKEFPFLIKFKKNVYGLLDKEGKTYSFNIDAKYDKDVRLYQVTPQYIVFYNDEKNVRVIFTRDGEKIGVCSKNGYYLLGSETVQIFENYQEIKGSYEYRVVLKNGLYFVCDDETGELILSTRDRDVANEYCSKWNKF